MNQVVPQDIRKTTTRCPRQPQPHPHTTIPQPSIAESSNHGPSISVGRSGELPLSTHKLANHTQSLSLERDGSLLIDRAIHRERTAATGLSLEPISHVIADTLVVVDGEQPIAVCKALMEIIVSLISCRSHDDAFLGTYKVGIPVGRNEVDPIDREDLSEEVLLNDVGNGVAVLGLIEVVDCAEDAGIVVDHEGAAAGVACPWVLAVDAELSVFCDHGCPNWHRLTR